LAVAALLVLGGGSAYYAGFLPWGQKIRSASDPTGAGPESAGAEQTAAGGPARIPLTSHRPETADPNGGPYGDVTERGTEPSAAPDPSGASGARSGKDPNPPGDAQRGRALVQSGRTALQRQELVTARAQLSEALACDLPLAERVQLKGDLTKLAQETVFSNRILPDDPFVAPHVVQQGETLNGIARRYGITDDFLARINGITDKNRIRAGQRIKVVKGPFQVVVNKEQYTLEVYLDQTFVKQYPVGLGKEDGTPTGAWKVHTKLKNPQYYPPRGGQIILADDPENPLGERWIGLQGVEGEAVGQERYGIHGTTDPDSIGKSVSMGCIRLHNADVEELYDLVVEGKSTVTVR